MKKITILFLLVGNMVLAQSRQQTEGQIKALLGEYGTFIVEGSAGGEQKQCTVTFNNGVVEILLVHSGEPDVIKSIGGVDAFNSLVESAMEVKRYTFNLTDMKLKRDGTVDFSLMQFVNGKTLLVLNLKTASFKSFYEGTIYKRNNPNEKSKVVKGFNTNEVYQAFFNDPLAESKIKSTTTTTISIPLKAAAVDSDWFLNGLKQLFAKYSNSNRDIEFTYGANRKTTSEIQLFYGAKHGYSTFYFDSGEKRLIELWENGKRVAFVDQFLPDGTQILKDGNGVYMTFYENGRKSYEAEHSGGKRSGVANWYYENGQLMESAIYKYNSDDISGYRWEIISSFHKDGTPRDAGTLKNGNGTWLVYDNNGNVTKVLTYKEGLSVN